MFINKISPIPLFAKEGDKKHLNSYVQTNLLSEHLPAETAGSLDPLCRQIKEKTGARVTIIDSRGTVLGDSDNDSSRMDNHADRPEIQQANITGTGSSIRYSDTTHYDFLYVARAIPEQGNPQGFIRLALPLEEINESIGALWLKINLVVILLLLVSGAILARQTDIIRKYVGLISGYAGALSHGQFKKRIYLEGAGEFSELARNLNEMALELETTIKERDEKTGAYAKGLCGKRIA